MDFDFDMAKYSAFNYASGICDINNDIKEQFNDLDKIRKSLAGKFDIIHENLMYYNTKFSILNSFLMAKRIAKAENFEKDMKILIEEYERTIKEFKDVYNQLCDIVK